MQHSGEELIYNGQRKCVKESGVGGGEWGGGGQAEGERDFQAILFNRSILPEGT